MKQRARQSASVHGVLLVDKPEGPTSHDVVAKARRAFHTRAVGHAGTLDPMATGLLVLALGQATKLVPYLTATEKAYEATLRLGVETDTLDAQGTPTRRACVPRLEAREVEAVADTLTGTLDQKPPAFSAIKHRGRKLYEHARRGEVVDVPPRRVVLHRLHAELSNPEELRLSLVCGKGFYVRSLARDFASALGTVGHLTRLRRVRVGRFDVGEAVSLPMVEEAANGDDAARASLAAQLISLAEAASVLPTVGVSEAGVRHARHGRPIPREEVLWGSWPEDSDVRVALLEADSGRLAAIAARRDDCLRVIRGFSP